MGTGSVSVLIGLHNSTKELLLGSILMDCIEVDNGPSTMGPHGYAVLMRPPTLIASFGHCPAAQDMHYYGRSAQSELTPGPTDALACAEVWLLRPPPKHSSCSSASICCAGQEGGGSHTR